MNPTFLSFYLGCKFRFKYFGPADIRRYQEKKIREMAEYAVRHSGFFREYYKNSDLTDVWKLPTVNKKVMMANLGDYNTLGLGASEIINFCLEIEKSRDFSKRYKGVNIGMSSGTSGNKGVELVTRTEESYMRAALLARYSFPKNEKINLAFILRVSAPAFNLNFGNKLTYISQLNPIAEIDRQLLQLLPNVISAPPSLLKLIAGETEAGRLPIAPKKLISYAEVLYPDVKDYLEKVYKCRVDQIYKCTEGPIAISCPLGSLHINEDLVAVETLNRDGTTTPAGQPCEKLIVTDLNKKSQPIIRYELNDIITISPEKCPCGSNFRVITEIQGRADDMFWSYGVYIFPDYISRAIISSSEQIDEYQAVQTDPGKVLVRIKLAQGRAAKQFETKILKQNIADVFEKYHCPAPSILVKFEQPEANPNSNKLIRIHREFNPENIS